MRNTRDPSRKEPQFRKEPGLWKKDEKVKEMKKHLATPLDSKLQLTAWVTQAKQLCDAAGIGGNIRIRER